MTSGKLDLSRWKRINTMQQSRCRLSSTMGGSPAPRRGGAVWLRRLGAALFGALLLVLSDSDAVAQPYGVPEVDDAVYSFLLRQQTEGRLPNAFLSHLPLAGYMIEGYLDSLALSAQGMSGVDRYLLGRYRGTIAAPESEWLNGKFGWAYPNGQDLFFLSGDGYAIQINPYLHTSYGAARVKQHDGESFGTPVWQWARGARASGRIGNHFFFEARLTENEARRIWAGDKGGFAPRIGQVSVNRALDRTTRYSYFTASGVVGVHTRFFEVRYGHDQNQWGYGPNSVVLSDYAPAYDHLQIRTTVGPFQYMNLFAGMSMPSERLQGGRDSVVPRKYAAMHRLAVQLSSRLQVGAFETVVFGDDSLGMRTGFDMTYLNPVLFYRAAERGRGSPDNVMLGGDLSWIAADGLRLYGQFVLDELVVPEIGRAYWGNKWGGLAGVHATRLPIENLSVQAEYARLRPFLYSHRSPITAFIHNSDVVGHAAGPNAQDLSFFAEYRPAPRWLAALTAAVTWRGRNTDSLNFGADPLRSYTDRVSDYNIHIGDGVGQTYRLLEARAGYELLPGFILEGALRYERYKDDLLGTDAYVQPYLVVRWNAPYESIRY